MKNNVFKDENGNVVVKLFFDKVILTPREVDEIPIDEIQFALQVYDNSPKIDEIKFVSDLCKKYNKSEKQILS